MRINSKSFFLFVMIMAFGVCQLPATQAFALSSYFTSQGCNSCHAAPATATCNGCHYHGASSLKAATNKTSYAPGETVTATLSGGNKSGWIRAELYDQAGNQLAVSTGNASGVGGSATFPAALTATAPATPGSYTWKMAYYGNTNGSGHSAVTVSTNAFTVAAPLPPADTTAPSVTAFTVPATSTSLSVTGIAVAASDNVGVTGFRLTETATAPLASATGWSASAPTNYAFASEGSKTIYAWAKDAAGNVSAAKSAAITITLPQADTTAPSVTGFTVPATSTSLSVAGIAVAANDNVGVTGFRVTETATAPLASATGWSASAPTSYTFASAGSKTLYAWAKDAAGNVSAGKSAAISITLPQADTKPVLSVSALASGSFTKTATLNISGQATDPEGIKSITVNGNPATIAQDGSFSSALTLSLGANTITVVATDNAGSQTSNVRTITYDPSAPVLTVQAPADNGSSAQSFVTVTGTVNENSTVVVTDNSGSNYTASLTGNTFNATVNLVNGVNTITITATDLAGNTVSAKRTITYAAAQSMTLSVTSPKQDITTKTKKLIISGTVADATGKVALKINVNTKTYKVTVSKLGNFKKTVTFSKPQLYAITITATDRAGHVSTATRNVIYNPNFDDDDDDDQPVTTTHPQGWTNPKESHQNYVNSSNVSSCTSCHSIDAASKGKPMSCYNCHGNEWGTPSTGGSTGGGTTGGTSHPFNWTNPESSHKDYVTSSNVSSCTSCHSTALSSKGQAMSCYNCHGQEW